MLKDDLKAHFTAREGYWFVPKMFGLGATPVTWQGWALTLGFAAGLVMTIRFVPGLAVKIVLGLALTAAFTIIAARKTDGGWRWHWGLRRDE